jgi:hypothetical protein
MSEGKQSEAWNHTAAIRLDLWKIALAKKGRRLKLAHFHPFLSKSAKRRLTREESRARLKAFAESFNGQRKNTKGGKGGHRAKPAVDERREGAEANAVQDAGLRDRTEVDRIDGPET